MNTDQFKTLLESFDRLNEGRYWDNNGKYEKEAEKLMKLVPESGPAKTLKGEIFRAATKIYYDYYNNGFGNEWPQVATFLRSNINLPHEVTVMLRDHAMGNVAHDQDAEVELMMDTVIEQLSKMKDTRNAFDMWDTEYNENAYTEYQDEYDGDDYDPEDDDGSW